MKIIKGILGAVMGFGIYFVGGTFFLGALNENYWSVWHGIAAILFGVILSLEEELFDGRKNANLIKIGIVVLFLAMLSL